MRISDWSSDVCSSDLSDWSSTENAFEQVKKEFGPVDVLVNNAGITRDGMFRKMSHEDWRAVIDTNLNSLFNVTKQVIEDMINRQWGRIINISSVNGQKGQFGQTNYSTAKAGIHGFTMALAQEVASKGVTVNTIRSEEHTSELQSLMRISYAVFCLKKKKRHNKKTSLKAGNGKKVQKNKN